MGQAWPRHGGAEHLHGGTEGGLSGQHHQESGTVRTDATKDTATLPGIAFSLEGEALGLQPARPAGALILQDFRFLTG